MSIHSYRSTELSNESQFFPPKYNCNNIVLRSPIYLHIIHCKTVDIISIKLLTRKPICTLDVSSLVFGTGFKTVTERNKCPVGVEVKMAVRRAILYFEFCIALWHNCYLKLRLSAGMRMHWNLLLHLMRWKYNITKILCITLNVYILLFYYQLSNHYYTGRYLLMT